MNPKQLLAHFERISEAPDAVAQLRYFILGLATRGKLVEQDPKDEPASELLKRIEAERKRLVEDGQLKKHKVKPSNKAETPFILPASWEWSTLSNIFQYDAGIKRAPKSLKQEQWLLELEDIEKNTGRLVEQISVSERQSKSTKSEFLANDILYGKLRPYLNKVIVADKPGYSTTEIVALRPYLPLCSSYCALALRRPDFVDYVTRLGQGTKMPRLRREDALVAPFPLPPLAEQQRIVARVEELMGLCDQLEAAQVEREEKRDKLLTASLHRLNQTDAEPKVFRTGVKFHLNTLNQTTARPDHMQHLRQSILNLAVRGKLVAQDLNDEPASKLLKRIEEEKEQLIAAKEIKRPKRSSRDQEANHSIPIPQGWTWVTFRHILVALQTGPFGSSLHQRDYQVGGTPVINPASIKTKGLLPIEKMAVGSDTLERLSNFKIRLGNIVMARRGEMGRCAVVSEKEDGWLCGTGSLILKLPKCICPHFISMLIGSPVIRNHLGGASVGATMQNLNQTILLSTSFGLPPLAEQKRIVARVDKLMAICDQLEATLNDTQTYGHNFLDAVLHEALSSSNSSLEAAQ